MHVNQRQGLSVFTELLEQAWSVLMDDPDEAEKWQHRNELELWSFTAAVLTRVPAGAPRIFTGLHHLFCPPEFDYCSFTSGAGLLDEDYMRALENYLETEGHLRRAINQAIGEARAAQFSQPEWLIATCPVEFDRLMQRVLRGFASTFANIAYSFDRTLLFPIQGFDGGRNSTG